MDLHFILGGALVGFIVGAAGVGGGSPMTPLLTLGSGVLATLTGSMARAYSAGVPPFYAATVAKTLLAVIAVLLVWKLLGNARAPR